MTQCEGVGVVGFGVGFLDSNPGSDCSRRTVVPIGTWNVRSMNQGQLEVIKQEMARVNIDILGI